MTDQGFLEVKNFEQFQHYKQRNPPWIKLHAALLDDYEFARLPDAAKMHLMGIWILASKTGNKIPADAEWIAKRIGATTPIDLEFLVSTGFISRLRRASDVLAPDKQMPIPSREEERRGKERKEEVSTKVEQPRLVTDRKAPSVAPNWPAELSEMYASVGVCLPGQIGRHLKPVVDRYGLERTREMWGYYIRQAPHLRFGKLDPDTRDTSRMSPADFAKNAGTWFAKTQPVGGGDAATAS